MRILILNENPNSAGEQGDTGADEDGRYPAAAVYVFVEKDPGGGGVANEGKRGAGGGGKRDIHVAKREEKRKEAERHGKNAAEEHSAAGDGLDGAEKPRMGANLIQVADAPHSARSEHVPGDGGSGNGEDGRPGLYRADGGHSVLP